MSLLNDTTKVSDSWLSDPNQNLFCTQTIQDQFKVAYEAANATHRDDDTLYAYLKKRNFAWNESIEAEHLFMGWGKGKLQKTHQLLFEVRETMQFCYLPGSSSNAPIPKQVRVLLCYYHNSIKKKESIWAKLIF